MSRPILSIVIPTCDRPDTLAVCLQTLFDQPNPEIEIVVQDNASDERTLAIIAASKDPRIVHNRSAERISMRNNFEDGVAAAKGDYISIIGDDDAYCAGALDWLVEMLKQHRPLAIRWHYAAYYWPSLSDANLGYFALHYHKFYGGWSWHDASEPCQRMLDGTMEGLWESLQIYHGIVSRELCEKTKAQTGGTLFQYHIPDVYVHTALLLNAASSTNRQYIDVKHPLSIYGMSGHSNGMSWFAGKAEDRADASPMAAWTKSAAEDTKLKSKVQNPIRNVKYHDYAALMLAVSLGLVEAEKIDHQKWKSEIIKEASENRWQIPGFHEAIPSLPYEVEICEAIKNTFGPLEELGEVEQPKRLQHLYPECWQWNQVCLTSAEPKLDDDVATAVKVLDEMTFSKIGLQSRAQFSEKETVVMREHLAAQVRRKFFANPPKMSQVRQ